ncbi:MAG: hypothetical protein C0624_13100 [Desulfuromonas sp.]|nr:MAG: hypothetical protein C0624_13100 [Desulfuromonas sp.]
MGHESVAELVARLELEPHPEGGWYREVYRAVESITASALPTRYSGERVFATSIYFLLTSESFSSLHRIASDEQWHYHLGSPLTVHQITPCGDYQPLLLGPDLVQGHRFQAVVPHDNWFGATVEEPGGYALVGCTVSPGFDFADFELANRSQLLKQFPQHAELIKRLTRLS